MTIADYIRHAQRALGLSDAALGELVGASGPRTVRRWKMPEWAKDRRDPSSAALDTIRRALVAIGDDTPCPTVGNSQNDHTPAMANGAATESRE